MPKTNVTPEPDVSQPVHRHVIVAVHQDGFVQRELLSGFCRIAHELGGMDLHYLPRLGWDIELARAGLPWRPDGIFMYNESLEIVAAVSKYGIPYVDLGNGPLRDSMPKYDEATIGHLAAEHLRERGYPHYACVGLDEWTGDPRCTAFMDRLGVVPRVGVTIAQLDHPDCWDRIFEWMKNLPLPCGIFAITDRIAQVVASVATRLGLSIPDEIGIVGVDADPILSRLSPVPLSSVRVPYHENGEWAARVLSCAMAGRPKPTLPEVIFPTEVTVQRSSDRRLFDDPIVTATTAWIRDHLSDSPSIDTIAQAIGIGRRTLERRFRAVTGSSVLAEVQQQRLERSRFLLRRGTTVQETAEVLGLTASRFNSWFRELHGTTPGDYQTIWLRSQIL